MDKSKISSFSPDIIDKILSDPELTKTLLQPDKDEKIHLAENCKVIFCPEPANLKFVLCDVEIDNQECAEINQAKEKFLISKEWIDTYRKEIKNLKDELRKNNILLESIQAILQQKINMPDSSL